MCENLPISLPSLTIVSSRYPPSLSSGRSEEIERRKNATLIFFHRNRVMLTNIVLRFVSHPPSDTFHLARDMIHWAKEIETMYCIMREISKSEDVSLNIIDLKGFQKSLITYIISIDDHGRDIVRLLEDIPDEKIQEYNLKGISDLVQRINGTIFHITDASVDLDNPSPLSVMKIIKVRSRV
jgi:hypothetical protein